MNEIVYFDVFFQVYTHNVGRDRIIVDMDVAYAGDCEFTVGVAGFKGGINEVQVIILFPCQLNSILIAEMVFLLVS